MNGRLVEYHGIDGINHVELPFGYLRHCELENHHAKNSYCKSQFLSGINGPWLT